MTPTRRRLVALAALLLWGGSRAVSADPAFSNVAPGEPALGARTSPVTIVEYGSMTCGHCVRFHRDVLPVLQSRYIDTGKVRFVYRDFPTSAAAVRGAVAARCAPAERYYDTLADLFATVHRWSVARDVEAGLAERADRLKIDGVAFRRCLADPAQQAQVEEHRRAVARRMGVIGTPTFLINGKVVEGFQTIEVMDGLVRQALPSGESR